ncbi:hypothetical protein DSECCO2_360360 [anaerobic digester metagenome]
MRLSVGDRDHAVTTLRDMPDHLTHDEQVPQVGMTGWHEPCQHMEGKVVPDGECDRSIVPVADDDTATHERGHFGEQVEQGVDRFDSEVVEESSGINRLSAGPGVECFRHDHLTA